MEILPKQISLFTEENATSSQVDFLVNRTQQPESGLAKMMNATYGRRCLERYGRLAPDTLWAKTFPALLVGMEGWCSMRCRLTWKLRGTKSSRLYFLLQVSELPTEGIEYGLWLLKTPTKMDGEVSSGKAKPVSGNSGTLAQEIMSGYKPTMEKLGLLPTPRASANENRQTKLSPSQLAGKHGLSLAALAGEGLLPTPAASNYKGASSTEALEKRGRLKVKADNLADQFAISGKTSQLNPRFVLEMMGFPPNHCDSAFEKIAWDFYQKKKSKKSFQQRLDDGEKKPSKQQETP